VAERVLLQRVLLCGTVAAPFVAWEAGPAAGVGPSPVRSPARTPISASLSSSQPVARQSPARTPHSASLSACPPARLPKLTPLLARPTVPKSFCDQNGIMERQLNPAFTPNECVFVYSHNFAQQKIIQYRHYFLLRKQKARRAMVSYKVSAQRGRPRAKGGPKSRHPSHRHRKVVGPNTSWPMVVSSTFEDVATFFGRA